MSYELRPNLVALYRYVRSAHRSAMLAEDLLGRQNLNLTDSVREQLLAHVLAEPAGAGTRRTQWRAMRIGDLPPARFRLVGLFDGTRLLMDANQAHRAPDEESLSDLALQMLQERLQGARSASYHWTTDEVVLGGPLAISVSVEDTNIDPRDVVPAPVVSLVDELRLVGSDGTVRLCTSHQPL